MPAERVGWLDRAGRLSADGLRTAHGPQIQRAGDMAEWMIHGGGLDAACERYGIARDRWLDLSTGINANAYPLPDLAREYWHRLPDTGLDLWLRETAARCYGVERPAWIVPTPGTQALIQWLPRLVPPDGVHIVSPTYGEYARVWAAAGHAVREGTLDAVADAPVVVVVNPNNPDGRISDPQRLAALARDRLVIVDEAFADVVPEVSLASMVGSPRANLIVLRSVGKMFGLAGMRLGFALAADVWADKLRAALGPWAVSGPAAAIGAVMLGDDAWIRASRVRLTAAAGRLDGLLVRARLHPVGGTPLFRLVECNHAGLLFEHLARHGILVRCFTAQEHWLRLGIPGNDEHFERLEAAMAAWRVGAGTGAGVGSGTRPGTALARG